jgi:hypothetical protein
VRFAKMLGRIAGVDRGEFRTTELEQHLCAQGGIRRLVQRPLEQGHRGSRRAAFTGMLGSQA